MHITLPITRSVCCRST